MSDSAATAPGRRPFLPYVLLGVASMASAEFQANVLLRGNVVTFAMALGMYAVLTAVAWLIGRRAAAGRADLRFHVLGGLFGMLVIEWFLAGFHPGSGKGGIQAAMFTNWAAVFTVPRLFTSERTAENDRVRRAVARTIVVYSVAAPLLVVALPVPRGPAVGILMSVYSIVLAFRCVPFLVASPRARTRLRWIDAALAAAAAVNVLWW